MRTIIVTDLEIGDFLEINSVFNRPLRIALNEELKNFKLGEDYLYISDNIYKYLKILNNNWQPNDISVKLTEEQIIKYSS